MQKVLKRLKANETNVFQAVPCRVEVASNSDGPITANSGEMIGDAQRESIRCLSYVNVTAAKNTPRGIDYVSTIARNVAKNSEEACGGLVRDRGCKFTITIAISADRAVAIDKTGWPPTAIPIET